MVGTSAFDSLLARTRTCCFYFIAINLPVTKQWAADQALQVVNRDFKAQMSTESVEVNFFGNVKVKGLKIKDYKGYDFIQSKEFIANSNWLSLFGNITKQFVKL